MSSKDGDKDAAKPAAAAEPTGEVRAAAAGDEEDEDASPEAIQNLFHHMALKQRAVAKDTGARAHGFWDKQPVPKLAEKPDQNEPIETKTVADVRATPYKLPSGFTWSSVDVADEKQLNELYDLLAKNYVEDDDAMFRFDYKPEFLRWALTAPGYFKDWMVGVRHASTGDLCAFISGIPVHTHVRGKEMSMCEINFLCVHKELRSKRLAPKLIKEVTRRVNLKDIWQAVYTAGVVVPSPVADCRYFHRTLNARKLLEIGFTRLGPRMTQLRFERLQKLAPEPLIEGWRPMAKHDISAVAKLLNAHLAKFALHLRFSDDEVRHWLLPREGVVSAYVVARPKTDAAADAAAAAPAPAAAAAAASSGAGASAAAAAAPGLSATNDKGESIVGFASYYLLPSTVLRHAKHSDLKAAYSYYNVAGDGVDLTRLMECALIAARNEGMDVFNALHLMQNETFFKELKFGPGDGTLHYYLYNWKCAKMKPSDVGIVLL